MPASAFFDVELFFALSGFLIGTILIKTLVEGREPITRFWIRRWMRTLPSYYVGLLGLAVASGAGINDLVVNGLFLQNFQLPKPAILGVSWSLVIEEWFYLVLPIAIVGARCAGLPVRKTLLAIGIVGVAACLVWRGLEAMARHPWGFIRYEVFQRMDALLAGVLLALLKSYRPRYYAELQHIDSQSGLELWPSYTWSGSISSVTASEPRLMHRSSSVRLHSVALFSFSLFDGTRPTVGRLMRRTVTHVSIISYSLYLMHDQLFGLMAHLTGPGIIYAAIAMAVAWAVSYLLHTQFERPALKLRDRWFGDTAQMQTAATSQATQKAAARRSKILAIGLKAGPVDL